VASRGIFNARISRKTAALGRPNSRVAEEARNESGGVCQISGQGNVSKWEAGKNRPTPDTFALMAKIAPDVDKFYFLDEAGIPRELFMGGVERVLPSQLMMATCVKCGTWSGIGQNVHNPDCDGVAKTQPTEADEFVDRLRPLVMKAAMRAGIAAGVTFAVLMAVAGILWGIFVSATHN
jgi:hypothetical protein